ncbi:MAG: hypothetical protein F6K22_02460 [Okeania sp. SIO2F4]|uniref:plasmid mobilization protein n=1 Tax=Okeania sp. SIO2F4 TaxID=2607790 RepID=UPI001428F06C|nr:hypothetical protein [Okeania sp. SIO2F4]NES01786.1 hypothetical protein [Okeania sp. SIO2F4]
MVISTTATAQKPKKNHILSIRLYKDDKKRIFELAKHYRISASEFLIRAALNKPLPNSPLITPEVKQAIEELTIETYKIMASAKELLSADATNSLLSELQDLAHKLNKLGCYLYGENGFSN